MNEAQRTPEKWPHAWANRHIKFSALDYINKVLGRLDDDSGALLKIRQQISKEMAMLSKNLQLSKEPDFILAPIPKWVAEKLLKIMWHRDFILEVDKVAVSDLSDNPMVVASQFNKTAGSGSEAPPEPTPGSVVVAREDGKFESKTVDEKLAGEHAKLEVERALNPNSPVDFAIMTGERIGNTD